MPGESCPFRQDYRWAGGPIPWAKASQIFPGMFTLVLKNTKLHAAENTCFQPVSASTFVSSWHPPIDKILSCMQQKIPVFSAGLC